MMFAYMLIGSVNAAFQDAEKAFNGIGVDVAADVFINRVVDGFVRSEGLADDVNEGVGFIGVEERNAVNFCLLNRVVQGMRLNVRNMERAHTAFTFHKRENRIHRSTCGAKLPARLAANASGIGFDDFAGPAHAFDARLHRLANAMGQVPRGFHAALQGPLHLAGADTFLRRAHKVDRLQPHMQGQVRRLENGPHANRKRLLARVAFAETLAGGPAVHASYARGFATERTNRAFRPKVRLDVGESRLLVLEMGDRKNGFSHGSSPMPAILSIVASMSSVTSPINPSGKVEAANSAGSSFRAPGDSFWNDESALACRARKGGKRAESPLDTPGHSGLRRIKFGQLLIDLSQNLL